MQALQNRHDVRPRAVLHLGAHLAEEAPDYAAAGVERVLWVEGNPDLMDPLHEALVPYPHQRAVHAVIADTDDMLVSFRVASFTMSSTILRFTGHTRYYPSIVEVSSQPARTITGDTLLAREGIDYGAFDMLNIDLEGAELLALKGMPKTLDHVRWVYAEVEFEELHAGAALVQDVDDFLDQRGFERVVLGNTGRGWGDALYVRK